ncbi:hypothetical protein FB645_005373 [Coemansia sp. IMI 203386]|nr:hypothetical protein FB645_005373 [Coemansia sp. IMI 203386]
MAEIPTVPGTLASAAESGPYRRRVEQLTGSIKNGFPGSQPVSFTKKQSMAELLTTDYLVCEKSDGMRVLLLLVGSGPGGLAPAAFCITRRNEYYELPRSVVPEKLGGDITLIDAELVSDLLDDGRRVVRLLAFDLLGVCGVSCMQKPLPERLAQLEHRVVALFAAEARTATGDMPFEVQLKTFYRSYEAARIYREVIPMLGHESDGLIFTSCPAPYTIGTCDKIIKWKPASENSVDFMARVVEVPGWPAPQVHLYVWNGKARQDYYSMLAMKDEDWTERLCKLGIHDAVIEVAYDPAYHPPAKWRFMRVRGDKANGNHASVVAKINDSIKDGVELDELVDAMADVKENWQQRSNKKAADS